MEKRSRFASVDGDALCPNGFRKTVGADSGAFRKNIERIMGRKPVHGHK